MKVETYARFEGDLRANDHPYMSGAFTPVHEELTAFYEPGDAEVSGIIPEDLDGVYLRNTQNPLHQPLGTYHVFDGDGMIHAVRFKRGRVEYRNRFLRTTAFQMELAAGRSLFAGLIDPPSVARFPGWGARGGLRDAASTDVVVHAGSALATFYQCGVPFRLDAFTLEPAGHETFGGRLPVTDGAGGFDQGMSAHCKVDEQNGELLFFNYSKRAPYMHYGVVNADNVLVHYTPIPLPGARLPHDMSFTENYAILDDFPLHWDPQALSEGKHAVRYFREQPSRMAVIPRRGSAADIVWFEAAPTYVLHWINAWEEQTPDGLEIVRHGYFQGQPLPSNKDRGRGFDNKGRSLGAGRYEPHIHEWRLNLRTGKVRERALDDTVCEFGMINGRYAGRPYRYSYNPIPVDDAFLFNGLMKFDHVTGDKQWVSFGERRYASESPMAPRLNARAEDDGYVVSFITDEQAQCSEVAVLDAKRLADGPVCTIRLPHKISSGTHSCWAPGSDVRPFGGTAA
ncbi:MAG: carotenoid oxygenase family protein [Burkholderiaceae bacterium]